MDSGLLKLWTIALPEDASDLGREHSDAPSAGMFSVGGSFWEIGVFSYSTDIRGDVKTIAHANSVAVRIALEASSIRANGQVDKKVSTLREDLVLPVISADELFAYEKRCLGISDGPRWAK